MNEKKTCSNCSYYHATIEDQKRKFWHLHDYCDFWERVIPSDYKLNQLVDKTEGMAIEHPEVIWDDIETGQAGCWGFNKRTDEQNLFTDEEMEECLKENLGYLKYSQKVDDNIQES